MPRRIQPQGRERGSSLISTATIPGLVPCPRATADAERVERLSLDDASAAATVAADAEFSAGADRLVTITSFACSWVSCVSSCEGAWRVMRYSGGGSAGDMSGPVCVLDASGRAGGAVGGGAVGGGAVGGGAVGGGSGGGAGGETAGADGGVMPTDSSVGRGTPRKSAYR
jgi:hypothetical protein